MFWDPPDLQNKSINPAEPGIHWIQKIGTGRYALKGVCREIFDPYFCHDSALRISLSDRISRRNRNRIQKYFRLFIRGPNGVESWKKGDRKSRDTLPLSTDVTPLLRICSKCLSFSYQVSVLATLLLFNSTCTDTSSHSLVNYRYRHFKRDKRCISTTLNKRREGYGGYESKGNVGSGSESKRFWLHYTTLHYEHFFNLINLPLHVL